MDNLSTHSGDDVDTWLASHPNVTLHYTPPGSAWVNMVETWLGIITRQAIRRGTFTSLRHLILQDQGLRHVLEHGREAVRMDPHPRRSSPKWPCSNATSGNCSPTTLSKRSQLRDTRPGAA